MLITLNLKLANNSRNYNITVVSITGLPLHGTLSTGDKPATGDADRATSPLTPQGLGLKWQSGILVAETYLTVKLYCSYHFRGPGWHEW